MPGDNITWFKITQMSWWTVNLKGIRYGSHSISDESHPIAIFDTGTSLLTMPFKDFKKFFNHILEDYSSIS